MRKIFFGVTLSVILFIIILSNYIENYKYNILKFMYEPNKKIRIFCMILTHSGNLNTRAKAVLEAWAIKCDKYRFISVIPDEWLKDAKKNISNDTKLNGFELDYNNISFLQPMNYTVDRYNKLTDKMFQTFKYLYKNYNDYDFYLKADDDTFVFVDNLRTFLSDKNRTLPTTFGYDFHCYVDRGYHSGGKLKKKF